MKHVINFFAALFLTLAVMIGCAAADARADEYTLVLRCSQIDWNTWDMTMIDFLGNEWHCESEAEDFPGNLYIAVMNDRNTPSYIYDDEITDLRFIGYAD